MTSSELRNRLVINTKMADTPPVSVSDNELENEEGAEETANKFANDGSFMEMFRKRLEEQKKADESDDTDSKTSPPRTVAPSEEEAQREKIYQVLCRQRIPQ